MLLLRPLELRIEGLGTHLLEESLGLRNIRPRHETGVVLVRRQRHRPLIRLDGFPEQRELRIERAELKEIQRQIAAHAQARALEIPLRRLG